LFGRRRGGGGVVARSFVTRNTAAGSCSCRPASKEEQQSTNRRLLQWLFSFLSLAARWLNVLLLLPQTLLANPARSTQS